MKKSIATKFRALATEFSPDETPVIYAQGFFYDRFLRHTLEKDPVAEALLKRPTKELFTIPYEYRAVTAGMKQRELHLIHPAVQIRGAQLLSSYGHALSEKCTRSKFSIRRPVAVRSQNPIMQRTRKGKRKSLSTLSVKPFFRYQSYNRLYKFHDSDEFLELERRFRYMKEADVQKCFYSIYTHSVSWAITEKRYAKDTQKAKSFENRLDKLFQHANYNETNGIVVGPELSRVFAELVLQDIDVLTEKALMRKGFRADEDYVIRRYIDNFYIFAHNKEVLEACFLLIEGELKNYKLYLNEKKTKEYSRPFLTHEGRFSKEVLKIVSQLFEDLTERFRPQKIEGAEFSPTRVYKIRAARKRKISAKVFINEYRNLLSAYKMDMGERVTLILGVLRKRLQRLKVRRVCGTKQSYEAYAEQRLARDVCAIIHHLCSTSPSTTAIERALECLDTLADICQASTFSKTGIIASGVQRLFDDIFFASDRASDNLERLSLEFSYFLPILAQNKQLRPIKKQILSDAWRVACESERQNNSFPYWQASAILYYAHCRGGYRCVVSEILKQFAFIIKARTKLRHAEVALSCLDFIRYPGFSQLGRKAIYKRLARVLEVEIADVNLDGIISNSQPWFVSWRDDFDIQLAMRKRRLQGAY